MLCAFVAVRRGGAGRSAARRGAAAAQGAVDNPWRREGSQGAGRQATRPGGRQSAVDNLLSRGWANPFGTEVYVFVFVSKLIIPPRLSLLFFSPTV